MPDSKTVAIVGTRSPDSTQERRARFLANRLSHTYGCTITTGGAYGIDQAAMEGADADKLLVYLPWASYNQKIIPVGAKTIVASTLHHPDWFASVQEYHPAPSKLTFGALALHARNYGIIEHTDLVIAFPDESGGGGTGQGIRIALGLNKPVMWFNKNKSDGFYIDEILANALGRLSLQSIAA